MTRTIKNSLTAVLVLVIISLVSVTSLAFANKFFPKYKPTFDFEAVKELNTLVQSGVDDQTAFDENYFSILTVKELDDFNKENAGNKTRNNKVLAVYSLDKGVKAGYLFTVTSAEGYEGDIIMLTAYTSNGAIENFKVQKDSESRREPLLEENLKKTLETVKGKKKMGYGDVYAFTGATNTAKTIAQNVNIGAKLVNEVIIPGRRA